MRIRGLGAANLVALCVLALVLWPTPKWAPQPGLLDAMIREISARHAHGYPDRYRTVDEMSRLAVEGPVVSTCGSVSEWAVSLLAAADHEARVVSVVTLDERNGWNDGHVLIEVRTHDGWVAYDIDRKVRPTDRHGRGLSLADWIARVPSGDYELEALGYPVNESAIRADDRRLLQVQIGSG